MYRCKDSSERCKQCRCRLDGTKGTWKFDGEGECIEKISVFTFEVVLIIAYIESISVPADIYVT